MSETNETPGLWSGGFDSAETLTVRMKYESAH